MDMTQMTMFFGWMSVVNVCVIVLVYFMSTSCQDVFVKLHKKMFNMKKEDLVKSYFSFLSRYKMLTFIFSIVPWIALKMMAR